ncbi:MAG: lipase [Chloroflexi bacterium OHK40]
MNEPLGDGPILIVGGFGTSHQLYGPLRAHLATVSGRPVAVAPLTLLDWAGVVATDSYGALLRIVHRAVEESLAAHRAPRLTLVAHSAGGVLARIYLGDQPYGPRRLVYNGFQRVAALVTLGTPHSTTRRGRQGGLNQVAFVQATYPGAYWRFIRYVTVMGRSVWGNQAGTPEDQSAFRSYTLISGVGAQWGDGVVPIANGHLEGAQQITLPDLRHAPGRVNQRWYGSTVETVRAWWEAIEWGA